MTKVKVPGIRISEGLGTNAYNHNTNTGIQKSMNVNDGINGVMSGSLSDIQVVAVNWDSLGLDEQVHGDEVKKLAADIVSMNNFDPNTYGSLTNYDTNTRNTTQILDNLAASDMTGAEKQIMDIVGLTKDFSREVTRKPGFLATMLGKGKNMVRNTREKYDTVSTRIENIVGDLAKVSEQLHQSSRAVMELDEIGRKEYHATALYIAAGRMALNQLLEEVNSVDETGKPSLSADYHLIRQLHGLEKRLHDLELTQIHRRQQSPQYAIILQNNEAVIDKLNSVTSTLIPAWRSGITTALAIQNTQKSANLINAIQNASDEYMLENSRMLRQSTTEVAQLSQRGIFDVNVLKEVQVNLEASLTDVLEVQREGALKRNAEMEEIRKLQCNINNIAVAEIKHTVERVSTPETKTLNIEERVEKA